MVQKKKTSIILITALVFAGGGGDIGCRTAAANLLRGAL